MATHDWHGVVSAHARRTGARHLTIHTIAELAAHLEDIYLDALSDGRTEADAFAVARAALAESSLSTVPMSRMRGAETRPWSAASTDAAGLLRGSAGDLRFAWRQLRRAPSFAVIAIATLGIGAGAATAI